MSEIEVGTSMARRPFEGEDLTGKRVRIVGDAEYSGEAGTVSEIIEGWDYPVCVEFDSDGGALLYGYDEIEVLL